MAKGRKNAGSRKPPPRGRDVPGAAGERSGGWGGRPVGRRAGRAAGKPADRSVTEPAGRAAGGRLRTVPEGHRGEESSADRDGAGDGGKTAVGFRAVAAEEAGQRIDNFLIRLWKSVPRSRIYRLLRKGEVRVNRKRVDAEYRLAMGDDIRLPPVRLEAGATPGRPTDSLIRLIEQAIVTEERHLLVIDKPAGLAVHGGSGMSFGVIEALRASRPEESLELVHRLDRDTSGCLLVARDRATLTSLHALIRDGGMQKSYLALVSGSWQLGAKRIDAPLSTDARRHGERHVRVADEGKGSVSLFKPVTFFGKRATLMQVDIPTGRTHQIRVHAAYAGHPLLGDDKYGDRERNAEMRSLGLKRTFLHAQSIAFDWPGSGVPFHASAPLPPELTRVLEAIQPVKRRREERRPRR